jgi:hypothetical protein
VIHIGDTYTDLGATAVDRAGTSLSVRDFLNGIATSEIVLDTATAATDTINYIATDTRGQYGYRHPHRPHRGRRPSVRFPISFLNRPNLHGSTKPLGCCFPFEMRSFRLDRKQYPGLFGVEPPLTLACALW